MTSIPRTYVLKSQCSDLLKAAVRSCSTGSEAEIVLRASDFSEKLAELAQLNASALDALEITSKPTVSILNDPSLIHYAWISDAPTEVEQQLVRTISSPLARKFWPLGGIWLEYADAIQPFLENKPATVKEITAKGAQKYWVPHVRYLHARTPQAVEAAKVEAAALFVKRQSDKRFVDWVGLDGDGSVPVSFDVRIYSAEKRRQLIRPDE